MAITVQELRDFLAQEIVNNDAEVLFEDEVAYVDVMSMSIDDDGCIVLSPHEVE